MDHAPNNPPPATAKSLFQELRGLPARLQADRLAELSPGTALRAEVEELLACDSAAAPFDAGPAASIGLVDEPELVHAFPTVDGFTIVGFLGRGSSSVVYKARQHHPPRFVALKCISAGLHSDPVRAVFRREARALAQLQHPGIATLYAAHAPADAPSFLVLELVEGRPLTEHCRGMTARLSATLRLFRRVCEAVEYAHARGVIHLDLKPANILVDRGDQPHVLDFGLAAILAPFSNDITASIRLTRDHVHGTLAYMSPEQAALEAVPPDTRADQYALGAILFELLTGRVPLTTEGLALPAALAKVRQSPRARLRDVAPALSRDLGTILAKALDTDPARRYASVAHFSDDLQRYSEHRPILARPPSAIYILRRFARRRWKAALAGALGVAMAIAGVILLALSRQQARTEYLASRDSLTATISNISHRLSRLMGTEEVRRELLESMLPQAARLARENPGDIAAAAAEADVRDALADVTLSAGDTTGALREREAVLAARRHIAVKNPTPASRAALSIALVKVGDILGQQAGPTAALPYYQESMAIDEALHEEEPDCREWLDNLTWSCERLADIARLRGNAAEARLLSERRLVLVDRLGATFPGHRSEYARAVANFYDASLLPVTSPSRADHLIAARRSLAAALAAEPLNHSYLTTAFVDVFGRADAALAAGDTAAHIGFAREAIAIAAKLHAADPQAIHFLVHLTDARATLSRALLPSSAADAYAVAYLAQVEAASLVDRSAPGPVALLSALRAYETAAAAAEADGRPAECAAFAELAESTLARAEELYPSTRGVFGAAASWWVCRAPARLRNPHLAAAAAARCLDLCGWADADLLRTLQPVFAAVGDEANARRATAALEQLNAPPL